MIINQKNLEELFKFDLHQYLLSLNRVDEHLPEAPDLEELWSKIGESYLPDADARIFEVSNGCTRLDYVRGNGDGEVLGRGLGTLQQGGRPLYASA